MTVVQILIMRIAIGWLPRREVNTVAFFQNTNINLVQNDVIKGRVNKIIFFQL